MEITLDALKTGGEATVTCLQTPKGLTDRLRDLGFVPGTRVRCRYRSPGGQVRAIECRGAVLALRARDLKKIWGKIL